MFLKFNLMFNLGRAGAAASGTVPVTPVALAVPVTPAAGPWKCHWQ